jgi:hypothetical protein
VYIIDDGVEEKKGEKREKTNFNLNYKFTPEKNERNQIQTKSTAKRKMRGKLFLVCLHCNIKKRKRERENVKTKSIIFCEKHLKSTTWQTWCEEKRGGRYRRRGELCKI